VKGVVVDDVALVLEESDSVATALTDLPAGREVASDEWTLTLAEDVPFGHKFALEPLPAGTPVFKYGEVIGRTTRDVDPGEWVHTHNCESTRARGDGARGGTDAGAGDDARAGDDEGGDGGR
jgi:altronate dehydratase small subunit